MKKTLRFSLMLAAATGIAAADEVTDWNRILLDALLGPPAVAAPLAQRPAAIVQAAVFDAVNGIERRYTPIHVAATGPSAASTRAAAVQAAYATLVKLFPAQAATFDQKRADSLIAIRRGGEDSDDKDSIDRGIAWGQSVADQILAWRSMDGFSDVLPPFNGGTAAGQWRPTPPAFASGLAPQMATMAPFAIESSSQFRPGAPPSLTGAQYTADFDEVKAAGSASSVTRTADQTLSARFWQSASPTDVWDQVATSLASMRHLNLLENARLLALLNISMADSLIGCWDAKYAYDTWRPITAIRLASTDGNASTIEDPAWTPLIATPPFPEYPAGHACATGAAAGILAAAFGENMPFGAVSDGMPGVTRFFSGFPEAVDEVKSARVFGGFHFRTACNVGQRLGNGVADYILGHTAIRAEDADLDRDH